MLLCEHLAPYYRQEIAAGNEVMSVSVGGWSKVNYIVYLNYTCKCDYTHINNDENQHVKYGRYERTPYDPESQILYCKTCKMSIHAPLTDDQEQKGYATRSPYPNPHVVATNENVFAPDDMSGNVKPTIIK